MGDFTQLLETLPDIGPMARRETYVDMHGHEINVMTPVDGGPVLYLSALTIETTQGQMRVQFAIKANSLDEAIALWREAARGALKVAAAKMRENERRIVLPGNTAANTAPFKQIQ